jgi:hypothetical protein
MFWFKPGSEFANDSQFFRMFGCQLTAASTVANATTIPTEVRKSAVRPALILVVGLCLVILGSMIDRFLHQQLTTVPQTPFKLMSPGWQLETVPIGQGALSVAARHYAFYTLTVPGYAHSVRVSGHFQTTGEVGNDIDVYVLNDEQFTDWKKGSETHTYYASGKATVGDVHASLPDGHGTYYLVFNNGFSALTAKVVTFNGLMVFFREFVDSKPPCCRVR